MTTCAVDEIQHPWNSCCDIMTEVTEQIVKTKISMTLLITNMGYFLIFCTKKILIFQSNLPFKREERKMFTLKAPVTTAADDIHNFFFTIFQRK